MPKGVLETEVKIPVLNAAAIRERLAALQFKISQPRQLEINILYDTPDHSLRTREMLLRLRQFGSASVLTWKGPSEPGPYKIRPELETRVDSRETMDHIFQQLGYVRTFRYEKYRTEFSRGRDGQGVVTIDETPIGNFLEIEGPGDWIDETAANLGFSRAEYVLASYGKLYLDYCRTHNLQPQNMVFASHD
jgi:adenylate cyclase class 2